jgi:PKD repeat protein
MRFFVPTFVILSLTSSSLCFAATTNRVSLSSDAVETNSNSYNPAVSGDGNFVVFESDATNLVADDTNGEMDIFVRDIALGITTRVSVSSSGEQSNGLSTNAAISADGRYVVFESNASNLVADDTNATTDIFLHDRSTGTTERINYSSEFGQTVWDSHSPEISEDGRYITYYSFADNLVANDTNLSDDIFVYDRVQAITERVSINNAGVEGNDGSYYPQISADGRYVSFASFADNLLPNDTNGRYDVFLYDRVASSIEMVSVTSDGAQADNHSFFSSVSGDGRYVAFESSASNLAPNDSNRRSDIFLRDRLNQTTLRISLYSDGTSPMGASISPMINSQGSHVVFSSVVDLLIDADTNNREDVYLYDIGANSLELVSVDRDGNLANFGSTNPSLSSDGLMVAFQSMATNLVADDTNSREDIFIRDRTPNLPPIANAGEDINAYLGALVTLNGSASYDPNGDAIVEYHWVIELAPAGSNAVLNASDTVTPTLLPDVTGDYVVSLTVSDGQLTSIADEVFIRVIENLPPVAVIGVTPLSGFAPLTVQFDGSDSSDPENAPLSYSWDFGTGSDGSDLVAPSFTYTLPGVYSVMLSVRDDFGNLGEAVVDIVVTASNQPPTVAPYTATPAQGPAPLQVSFIANASDPDDDALSYFWDFGDGNNSTEENPQHVFFDPGSYTVTVQVSDGEFTTSAQLFVAVQSPLTIEDIEAELDWGKHHHGSKLKLDIELGDTFYPQAEDLVRVAFGDLILLKAPFADFELVKPGIYIYKSRRVYAKFDVLNGIIKVSKRLKSGAIDIGQPVPVMISIGETMATDQVTLSEDEYHDGDRKTRRKHAKFCKCKSGHENHDRHY